MNDHQAWELRRSRRADLERKRGELMGQIESIRDSKTRDADGNLTAGQSSRFRNLCTGVERIDDELGQIRTDDERFLEGLAERGQTEMPTYGNGSTSTKVQTRDDLAADEIRRNLDESTSRFDFDAAYSETVERLVTAAPQNSGERRSDMAELFAVNTDPHYASAFGKFLQDPLTGYQRFSSDEREAWGRAQDYHRYRETRTAMSEASTGVGGALVPYFLDPSVILTNTGAVDPMREVSRVVQITSNIWHGVSSDGVTAEWIGEATEVSDGSPSLSAPSVTTYKGDGYLQASMELIADSALSTEIARLLGDAKTRLEATAFAVGTGTSQPRGIITACSGGANSVAGNSGAAGAADLVVADIFATANALNPRWRGPTANTNWLASFTMINKIRLLAASSSPLSSSFWATLGDGSPDRLIGYPIHEVSNMDSTIVSGSNDDVLLFGDTSQYVIVDRLGISLTFNPLVLGSNRRPTGESAWVAFWRTGADSVASNSAKVLRL
jgi:HK97 family phage major capsid protein